MAVTRGIVVAWHLACAAGLLAGAILTSPLWVSFIALTWWMERRKGAA